MARVLEKAEVLCPYGDGERRYVDGVMNINGERDSLWNSKDLQTASMEELSMILSTWDSPSFAGLSYRTRSMMAYKPKSTANKQFLESYVKVYYPGLSAMIAEKISPKVEVRPGSCCLFKVITQTINWNALLGKWCPYIVPDASVLHIPEPLEFAHRLAYRMNCVVWDTQNVTWSDNSSRVASFLSQIPRASHNSLFMFVSIMAPSFMIVNEQECRRICGCLSQVKAKEQFVDTSTGYTQPLGNSPDYVVDKKWFALKAVIYATVVIQSNLRELKTIADTHVNRVMNPDFVARSEYLATFAWEFQGVTMSLLPYFCVALASVKMHTGDVSRYRIAGYDLDQVLESREKRVYTPLLVHYEERVSGSVIDLAHVLSGTQCYFGYIPSVSFLADNAHTAVYCPVEVPFYGFVVPDVRMQKFWNDRSRMYQQVTNDLVLQYMARMASVTAHVPRSKFDWCIRGSCSCTKTTFWVEFLAASLKAPWMTELMKPHFKLCSLDLSSAPRMGEVNVMRRDGVSAVGTVVEKVAVTLQDSLPVVSVVTTQVSSRPLPMALKDSVIDLTSRCRLEISENVRKQPTNWIAQKWVPVAVPSRTKILLFSLDVKMLPPLVFGSLNTPALYLRYGSRNVESCAGSYQIAEDREYPRDSPFFVSSKKRLIPDDNFGFLLPRNVVPSMGANVKTTYQVYLVIVIDQIDYCLASFATIASRGKKSQSSNAKKLPNMKIQLDTAVVEALSTLASSSVIELDMEVDGSDKAE